MARRIPCDCGRSSGLTARPHAWDRCRAVSDPTVRAMGKTIAAAPLLEIHVDNPMHPRASPTTNRAGRTARPGMVQRATARRRLKPCHSSRAANRRLPRNETESDGRSCGRFPGPYPHPGPHTEGHPTGGRGAQRQRFRHPGHHHQSPDGQEPVCFRCPLTQRPTHSAREVSGSSIQPVMPHRHSQTGSKISGPGLGSGCRPPLQPKTRPLPSAKPPLLTGSPHRAPDRSPRTGAVTLGRLLRRSGSASDVFPVGVGKGLTPREVRAASGKGAREISVEPDNSGHSDRTLFRNG